ncbi:alpha/beta hydrolase [Nocardia bovistercoris]|uniref:Alpha/beta fold hydrolase n=1 Tax=Nocardia bovistercoris TaxID=2785916 RepID=A0A931N462_9NOCA|nr:alpha/beta hydrolase [Nocardia bovistercoris]MBH0777921.1 alpha/beta fold hydrolase [Nocardia bovistercoris]
MTEPQLRHDADSTTVREVEFRVEDATVLRGRLHTRGPGGRAGIVMCHGFGGVASHIDHYAALFADAGFAVLVYDHRGFGASDGYPRQEVDPHRQLADWRDAITFATAQPEFDDRYGVGIWGSSFAGGLAVVLAANDPRVRCVVAQIPNLSGHRNARRLYTPEQIERIHRRAAIDRAARRSGAAPATVPIFSTDPAELCVFPGPIPTPAIAAAIAAGTWTNTATLRSMEHLVEFEPCGWLTHLNSTPLLMIIAEDDRCTFTDIQRDCYELVGGTKKLSSYPGGHFEAYTTYFEHTGPPARDWFIRHLPTP